MLSRREVERSRGVAKSTPAYSSDSRPPIPIPIPSCSQHPIQNQPSHSLSHSQSITPPLVSAGSEIIGRGSFSIVYRCQRSNKVVAVKSVDKRKLHGRLLGRLWTEIEILRRVSSHPHIVHLLHVQEYPNKVDMIMEYCNMGDLSSFIRRYPRFGKLATSFPDSQHYQLNSRTSSPGLPLGWFRLVHSFLGQLASALQCLHQQLYIHRDLKPQNILLTLIHKSSIPVLKLADFGFARSLPEGAMAETLCGSPLYMAPEILRYEPYDARADMWSLGVIVFEMMTGRQPFRAQNHVALLKCIEETDIIPFPPQESVNRRNLTLKMTSSPTSPSASPPSTSSSLSRFRGLNPLQGPEYRYNEFSSSLPEKIEKGLPSASGQGFESNLRNLVCRLLQRDPNRRCSPQELFSDPLLIPFVQLDDTTPVAPSFPPTSILEHPWFRTRYLASTVADVPFHVDKEASESHKSTCPIPIRKTQRAETEQCFHGPHDTEPNSHLANSPKLGTRGCPQDFDDHIAGAPFTMDDIHDQSFSSKEDLNSIHGSDVENQTGPTLSAMNSLPFATRRLTTPKSSLYPRKAPRQSVQVASNHPLLAGKSSIAFETAALDTAAKLSGLGMKLIRGGLDYAISGVQALLDPSNQGIAPYDDESRLRMDEEDGFVVVSDTLSTR